MNTIKKTWHWVWHSNSPLSWIISLMIIFIAVKFLFFPALSFVFGTQLPLAGVESSSMDHLLTRDKGGYSICGKFLSREEYLNFDTYWEYCGEWYEQKNISKEEFQEFPLSHGFAKGDILIVWGHNTAKVGDIIIFHPNQESLSRTPIVHRIVEIDNGIYKTKGDHNGEQLIINNNLLKTDETTITEERIIGTAVLKIPLLGWLKIIIIELLNLFR